MIGLAVGDALGAAVEFKSPGSFAPVTGYRSGGRIRRALPLIEPMDMTREYDRILRMLEMTTQAKIELTPI